VSVFDTSDDSYCDENNIVLKSVCVCARTCQSTYFGFNDVNNVMSVNILWCNDVKNISKTNMVQWAYG
jgi:hypothetical protein